MPFFTNDECKKNYKLTRTLGTGSFATVKLATKLKDSEDLNDDESPKFKKGSKWAVKIIQKKNLEQEDKDALESEVKILEDVDHPNIIKLVQVFDTPTQFYMVLELCPGGELFDRIVEKEKYSEQDAANVVKKVADALAYCHKRDIVHRDLKPENLLLTTEGDDAEVKIADFGLAKILNADTLMQTACGTPGYVAPEILEAQPYDDKVDAWSLGVITYILLCGFPPFYDDNNAQLFASIKAGSFDFPAPYWDDISEDAKLFIKKLLTVDPTERLGCNAVADDPWITTASSVEINRDELGNWNKKRKFKMAAEKIMMINALSTKT